MPSFIEYVGEHEIDFILYRSGELLQDTEDNPVKKSIAIQKIALLVSFLQSETERSVYIDLISRKLKVHKGTLKTELNENLKYKDLDETLEKRIDLPKSVSTAEFDKFGFYEDGNKYFFLTKNGIAEGSNFTIRPLFHIYSKTDNKRLVELVNEHNYKKIVDIPSKCFVSFEQFQQLAYQEGNYLFFGNKVQFYKILSKISDNFPLCNELKTLGWQREGFLAFSNGIVSGADWIPVDNYGICEYKGTSFFSPAFSVIYQDVREDDDDYENDRYFIYKKSPLSFNQWCKQFKKVFSDKAPLSIAFLVASCFRDLIYDKFKVFPHLFLFGQPQSGKSALAWSLSNVFFNNLPAFNLNSGTQVGFFRRLARFRNTISWFDEYTNEINPVRFQTLKSAYDGIGHEKGKMTKDNRTEITRVNTACLISGQHLPTNDDNSLFTRSITISFPRRDENNPFSEAEIKSLDKLREYEKQGISGILTEVVKFRETVEREYPLVYNDIYNRIRAYFLDIKAPYTDRLLVNFTCLLAIIKVFEDKVPGIDFGFTYEDLYEESIRRVKSLSNQIKKSDALASFFSILEFLLDNKQIEAGIDFKIDNIDHVSIKRDGETKTIKFEAPTKVLFLRFSKVHPLYLEAFRKQRGQTGVDLTSLIHYINNNYGYLGLCSKTRFENSITSAYCFIYDRLDINLERFAKEESGAGSGDQERPPEDQDDDLPF